MLTGKVSVKNLGKGFEYSSSTTQSAPIAIFQQERGRGGRIDPAVVIFTSKETKEIKTDDDIESAMVSATFEGDMSTIKEQGYD